MGKPHYSEKQNKKASGTKLRDLTKAQEFAVYEPPNASELLVARVYVNFGVESGVELDGRLIRVANRRQFPTVAGDLVYTDGKVVEGIKPRGRTLARYADEGGVRLIASNLEQVGVVISASTPPLHEGFIDRYLVYCRIMKIPLFIILNKMDEAEAGIVERMKPFQDAGVDLFLCSATMETGLKAVRKRLERGISVLTGLSGVGKSTIINAMLGEDIPVQEVSAATNRGRHTTTAAEAYKLGETLLIDTPGIKKFGFIGISPTEIIKGFPEFEEHVAECKYEDCLHLNERGCGVRAAMEEGRIDERRLASYQDLVLGLMEQEVTQNTRR
ncbi:ribosome small subunit-dependent GTPase A [Candidatus Sumerlaeota bacterium]|nr:ribosome small subunit-dependent GTPase A [Candidatus Sumerlaeota bacterium]